MKHMTFEEFIKDHFKNHLSPEEVDILTKDILTYRETGSWPFDRLIKKEKILSETMEEIYVLVEKDMTLKYEEYLKTFQRPEQIHK